jgi:hypothetical protein
MIKAIPSIMVISIVPPLVLSPSVPYMGMLAAVNVTSYDNYSHALSLIHDVALQMFM